jgi:hypothetical protein
LLLIAGLEMTRSALTTKPLDLAAPDPPSFLGSLLALLWQIKSSERILTAGWLGDLGSRRHGGLGRGS